MMFSQGKYLELCEAVPSYTQFTLRGESLPHLACLSGQQVEISRSPAACDGTSPPSARSASRRFTLNLRAPTADIPQSHPLFSRTPARQNNSSATHHKSYGHSTTTLPTSVAHRCYASVTPIPANVPCPIGAVSSFPKKQPARCTLRTRTARSRPSK